MLENARLVAEGEYCGYCTDDVNLNAIPTVAFRSVSRADLSEFKTCELVNELKRQEAQS